MNLKESVAQELQPLIGALIQNLLDRQRRIDNIGLVHHRLDQGFLVLEGVANIATRVAARLPTMSKVHISQTYDHGMIATSVHASTPIVTLLTSTYTHALPRAAQCIHASTTQRKNEMEKRK